MTPRRAKAHDPARAVLYVRVSTDKQDLGPEAQRAAAKRYAKRKGITIVAEHEDRGVSGAAPVDKRPGLLSALSALREHEAGVLLVAKRDRLARDPVVGAVAERLTARAGARIVAADGNGNGDDAADVLMRRIVDAFAEYERAVIAARTRAALAAKRERGEKLGGDVPFGHRLSRDGATLAPDAKERRVLRRIRELRAEGASIRTIAAQLDAEGHPARGARWHHTTVARLLKRDEARA